MYHAHGLVHAASDFTLDAAEARLGDRFPGYTVARAGDQITVSKADWEIALLLNTDPGVLADSANVAERIAGTDDGLDLARCARRVEVWSDTPDPFVEHLADFHAVLDVLRSFTGVVPIDPAEPALM